MPAPSSLSHAWSAFWKVLQSRARVIDSPGRRGDGLGAAGSCHRPSAGVPARVSTRLSLLWVPAASGIPESSQERILGRSSCDGREQVAPASAVGLRFRQHDLQGGGLRKRTSRCGLLSREPLAWGHGSPRPPCVPETIRPFTHSFTCSPVDADTHPPHVTHRQLPVGLGSVHAALL